MADDELDLRDFPYMPLYIARLQRSKAWLLCKREPALAFYLINLWMRSWHEVPAGSIEDDDDVLADAAMCDLTIWTTVKERVLRGWSPRGGRLFNSTVTEIAQESQVAKQKQRQRTEAARQAKSQGRHRTTTDDVTTTVTRSVTDNVTASKGREGKGREDSVLRTGADAPPDARADLWKRGLPVIQALVGYSESQARRFLGKMLKSSGDNCPETLRVILEAQSLRPANPSAWLLKAIAPPSERDLLANRPANSFISTVSNGL